MKNSPNRATGLKAAVILSTCLMGGNAAFAGPEEVEFDPLEFCTANLDRFKGFPDQQAPMGMEFNTQYAGVEVNDPTPPNFENLLIDKRAAYQVDCVTVLGQANIASFMQNLASSQIATLPNLIPLLTGNSAGVMDVQTSQGNNAFNMATPDGLPVWARLQGRWTTSDTADGTYLSGAAGGHYTINPNTLVGLMFEFDTQTQETDNFSIDGSGYMVGPYFVAKLPSQPVYFEASYLVGTADNTLEFGELNGDVDFETDRALASIRVAGDFDYGDYTLTPNLAASQLKSTQGAIAQEEDDDIPEQSTTTRDVTIGLDVSRSLSTQHGTMVVSGGLAGIFSQTEGDGFADQITSSFEGERARIHLGTRYTLDSGMILSAAASYDGIGADDYESIGVQLQMEMSF